MTVAQQLDEQAFVLEKVGELQLPPGVTFSRMEDTTESTGEPSITFFFKVSLKYPLTNRRLDALSKILTDLRQRIFPETGKFPQVRFIEVR